MKTFEQLYKSSLITKLKALLSEYRLTVSNDINNTKIQDEKDILCIINTGQGIRSSLPGYDATQVPFFLAFKVATNDLQVILSKLVGFVNDVNGVKTTIETTDDLGADFVYTYKITYNNPSPFGQPYDISTRMDTISYSNVYLNGTCLYSSDAPMEELDASLIIDGVTYLIDHILNYQAAHNFNYSYVDISGSLTQKKAISNYQVAYSITLSKVKENALQAKLMALNGKNTIILQLNGETPVLIPGIITSVQSSGDNGFGAISFAFVG